jgi:flagellar export protein FliJ
METLLRLREAVRNERRFQLAEARKAAEAHSARSESIAGELAQLRRRVPIGVVDLEWLLAADRYEAALREESRHLNERLATLHLEIDRRREALVAADRDVRALELLRDAHQRRQLAADERRSMKELDEAAHRRFALMPSME